MTITKNQIIAAAYAAEKERGRYALDCLLIEKNRVVATNGRLALILTNNEALPTDYPVGRVLVNAKEAAGVVKSAPTKRGKDAPLSALVENDKVQLKGSAYVSEPLENVNAYFPNVDYVDPGPDAVTHKFSLAVEYLEGIVKAAKRLKVEALNFGFSDNETCVQITENHDFRLGVDKPADIDFKALLCRIRL